MPIAPDDHRLTAYALGELDESDRPEVEELIAGDPEARALIAAGFDQWAAVIGEALRSLHADGKLPSDIDPDDLATTLLATLQGGLLLAQVHRSARPFETAIDTILALAIGR